MPFMIFKEQCEDALKDAGVQPNVFEPPKGIADLCTFSKNADYVFESVKSASKKYSLIKDVTLADHYINFHMDEEKAFNLLDKKLSESGTVVIDFSSPNIAKPMNIGHLRSTIIGDSLRRIYSYAGWNVVADNHVGDWGTQFGKLLYAYIHWSSKEKLDEDPIGELTRIYIKFHKEAEKHPELIDEAREYFKCLENGDEKLKALWKLFVDISMKEFGKTYDLLNVKFDYALGESFYVGKAKELVKELLARGIAKTNDDGSVYIDLKPFGLTDLIILKSDGSTLYQTRELAAIKYREETFHPDRILYVVGQEQSLYFKQVFSAAKLMGFDSSKYEHVGFGLVVTKDGKLSTRKGKIILLKDVIDKAFSLAMKILEDRDIENKEDVARKVAVGAIKFNDLKQNRTKDVEFDWDRIMSFEGDSGPYVQYTNVRIKSILRKIGSNSGVFHPKSSTEKKIVKELSKFNYTVKKALNENKPNYIASYLLELCTLFNTFYHETRIIGSGNEGGYITFLNEISKKIESGLYLLGIEPLERM